MATDDSFGQFELLLREKIAPSVINLQLTTDDISWRLIPMMEPISDAGRKKLTTGTQATGSAGLMAEWRIRIQRAGLITGGAFGGTTWTMLGAGSDLPTTQAATALYPDPTKVPGRGYQKIQIFLKRMKGNLTVNADQIMADLATTPIEEVAADFTVDIVERARRLWSNYFWSDGSGLIADVNLAAGYSVGEGSNRKSVEVDNGTCFRFDRGDRVVAGSNVTVANYGSSARTERKGSTTVTNSGVMRVTNVDRRDRNIQLESEPGEGTVTLSDNDTLMFEGMYDFSASTVDAGSRAPTGIERYLIDSGSFPGTGLDVANYGELRSWVYDNTSAKVPPEASLIAEAVDNIVDSENAPPSVAVAEASVWTLWAELERGAFAAYQVPQGANFQASGGVSGPVLSHQNHVFQRFPSSLCRQQAIYGITPESFIRFIPAGDLSTIRWFYTTGVMSGAPSIFGPTSQGGSQLTEIAQAPFDMYGEFGLTEPQKNFRILGVHSQRSQL